MTYPNELDQQIENLRTLQQSYDGIAQAAEAYNTGKVELAANITSKGVEASATETLPELAEKVRAIAQESYTINGGEMYAKQLFGSLESPNYWNLYDILAQLLSDGRLVNYGGILLAEYYKGYDSLALAEAGAGGAYVVSDKDENGQFKMYTEDTTHTWATEEDGKGNRWVAYCFADEYHDFQITNTGTSPRSIFTGRKVGTISSLVDGRISQIVVPDNNELNAVNTAGTNQNWSPNIVVRNINDQVGTLITLSAINYGNIYVSAKKIRGCIIGLKSGDTINASIGSLIVKADEITGVITSYINFSANIGNVIVKCPRIVGGSDSALFFGASANFIPTITFEDVEEMSGSIIWTNNTLKKVYLNYGVNNRTKSVTLKGYGKATNMYPNLTDIVLKDGWCKPLDLHYASNALTEENIVNHILNRLGDNTGQPAITITLGATNLAKLTNEEKAIATNKGFILA